MILRGMDRSRIVIMNLPTAHLKSDTDIMARGPLSVHSYLKKHSIDSILVDLAGTKDELWNLIPDSDFYGLSTVTCQIFYAQELAEFLKSRNPRARIIMGGAHAKALPEDCLRNRGADIVVTDEGEECLLALMTSQKDIVGIPGFAFLDKSGNIINTGIRPLEENIEKYYPLRFNDYGIYRYLKPGVYRYLNKHKDDLQLNVMISRGCYSACKFCMSGQKANKRVRHRNIKNAVDELIYYKERWGITRVYFDDDEMLTKKEMLVELCKEMPRSGLDWLCLGRTDRIDERKLQMMVDSGCVGIVFGVEHFSDRVLTKLNKNNTCEHNYNALVLAAKYNLKVRAQMMTGCLPYETWDDVKITGEYVKRVINETDGKVKFSFHIFQPLPGTISYLDALASPEYYIPERLTDFSEFQTVGNFQRKEGCGGSKRPRIAHRNSDEVFAWYDYLVDLAGEAEVASV